MSNGNCPKCTRELFVIESRCEFRCCAGHVFDELYLAANHLGPFAPARPPQREYIPGFRWSEQEQCYVRIASDEEVAKSVADDMRRWHAAGRPGWL